MDQDLIVTKHNDLIEASYKLTLEEQRLLLICIAKLDSRPNTPFPDAITISAEEYSDQYGILLRNAYQQLQDASSKLYERDIKIKNAQKKERMRWVYRVIYHDGEGCITLKFSPDVKPYISQLNGFFKSYHLKQIARMKSTYSIRLYELLNQWRDSGKRFFTLADFKEMLQINDAYDRYTDLRKWVIEPAIEEINDKTDLHVTFQPEKKSRKVVKLVFFFASQREPIPAKGVKIPV